MADAAAKREGLRSKLKRLVEREWVREERPGLFTVAEMVARVGHVPSSGVEPALIGASPSTKGAIA
ncbi:hypothetical protein OIE67_30115 [Nonomuraea fuscirosea]|uniref:hypothetical protein n=1 Tax=Nonomuraea fuscirosea TaxID=1291556 RepID=UPI002DDA1C3D|nr:hypothetical protein [Nonomuraea fuscirosea]WSA48331.1 hypothetical protein OIE67_30115 [Nonomuraea fuscirosea]